MFRNRRVVEASVLAGLSIVLTSLLYAPSVGYGFHYDDYHFVRPYTVREVLATFRGPWDQAAIETPYYRPLTIALYAGRFALLGLNAHANHILSLAMFAVAACLFGSFALRITSSRLAALLGVAVFATHPGMPYSAVVWVTNQMHLAELLVVLTAFVWWFEVRAKSAAWWWPLLVLQAAAFLIKEDGVMLIPAVVALHLLRRLLVERTLPHPPWSFLIGAAIVGGVLLTIRWWALHGIATHRLPSLDQAWTNWTRGLQGPYRLLPAKRFLQPAASWFVTLAPITALALWRWMSRELRFAFVAGATISSLFVLPFAFIVKAEQLHLVVAGAAMVLTASLAGIIGSFRRRLVQTLLCATAIGGLATMTVVMRDIMRDFEPFGRIELSTDRLVDGWAAVPVELREFLVLKRAANARERPDPDPSRSLPVVAFGLHDREQRADGSSFRWMAAPTAHFFIAPRTRLVSFSVRHEIGSFREAARIRVVADGRLVDEHSLNDDQWHALSVVLKPRDIPRFGGMHVMRIELDRVWIPSQIIPGSHDTRVLGVQVTPLEIR